MLNDLQILLFWVEIHSLGRRSPIEGRDFTIELGIGVSTLMLKVLIFA